MIDAISPIITTHNALIRYSKLDFKNVTVNSRAIDKIRTSIDKTVSEILSPLLGIEPKIQILHDNIMGTLGEKGFIEVWSTMIAAGSNTRSDIIEKYQILENRFDYLLGVELLGINLMIEAYYSMYDWDIAQAGELVDDFWNKTWKGKMENQTNLFLNNIEKVVVSRIDTLTAGEFNKWPEDVYTNSSILARADEFVGEVRDGLTQKNKTGMITARIVNFPHYSGNNLPSKYRLGVLQNETGTVYDYNFTARKDGETIKNKWGESYKYEMIYCYFNIPQGSYKLVNQETNYSGLIRTIDCNQTIKITADNKYGTYGMTAFLSMRFSSFGSYGTGDGQFKYPRDVAVDSNGYVYVTDANIPYIQKFDSSNGKFISKLGNGVLISPRLVAVDKTGNIYVADEYGGDGYLKKIGPSGTLITTWQMKRDSGDGDPRAWIGGLTVDDDNGYVYAAVRTQPRGLQQYSIHKYHLNGSFVSIWESSEFGVGAGHLAIDKNGFLYVGSTDSVFIMKFDANGNFIMRWGDRGSENGKFQLGGVGGIGVDSHGGVYVADAGNHRIQKFDTNGNFITKWGSQGTGVGQYNTPHGIAVDLQGNLYVVDNGNYRIQKTSWQIGTHPL
jgi:DNA-binding beta-propeller fold protein YncE